MDDRLKRTVALLLAGGAVLVVIGLGIVFRDDPEPIGYRVDGLNNGLPLPEMDPPKEGLPLDLIAGSVVALGGVMLGVDRCCRDGCVARKRAPGRPPGLRG